MLGPLKQLCRNLQSAYHKWSADDGALLAAAVAYYLALAFFPLLLILLSGFGYFLEWTDSGQDARDQILRTVEEQVSPALRNQVEDVLSSVGKKSSLGGPIGVVTLLIAAIAIFARFDAAFDRIWNVKPVKRGFWRSVRRVLVVRLKAFSMLIALGAVVFATFASGMVLSTAEEIAGEIFSVSERADWLSELLVSFLLNTIVFTLIYRLVPRAEVPWRAAWRGGVLAGVIWEIGRQVLSAYVIGQKYSSAYGVVGAFLAIMLWGYYAVSVIFFGAEFAQTIAERPSKGGGRGLESVKAG